MAKRILNLFKQACNFAGKSVAFVLQGRRALYNGVQDVLTSQEMRESSDKDESDKKRIHDAFKFLCHENKYSHTYIESLEMEGVKPDDAKNGVIKDTPFGSTLYRWLDEMKQQDDVVILGVTFDEYEDARAKTAATRKANKRSKSSKKKTTDADVKTGLAELSDGQLSKDLDSVFGTMRDLIIQQVAKSKQDKVSGFIDDCEAEITDMLSVDVD